MKLRKSEDKPEDKVKIEAKLKTKTRPKKTASRAAKKPATTPDNEGREPNERIGLSIPKDLLNAMDLRVFTTKQEYDDKSYSRSKFIQEAIIAKLKKEG